MMWAEVRELLKPENCHLGEDDALCLGRHYS